MKILIVMLLGLLLTGCTNNGMFWLDKEGWKSSQKD